MPAPVTLAPCWLLLLLCHGSLSLPSLPSQNTSELEGAGDCHQSSINTLPDVSLVRPCLGAGWEQEALWGSWAVPQLQQLCHTNPTSGESLNAAHQMGQEKDSGWLHRSSLVQSKAKQRLGGLFCSWAHL